MHAAYTGKQISERRKALGLTQKELAEKLHVTDKAVSKWERGINFPDLGLMENLAAALDTTPACLLGLEDADRDAVVSSIAELYTEQLEDARKDMRWIGWSSIIAAVFLVLVYQWIPRHTVQAYQTLSCMTVVITIAGLFLLFKYGEIKKWGPAELFIFYGALFPILLYLFIQFFTGHSPHPLFGLILIAAAACCLQWLFWRIMRPGLVKSLPLILTAGFALWHCLDGNISVQYTLPAICCLAVWAICFRRARRKRPLVPKQLAAGFCILLIVGLVLLFLCYPSLVRAYVSIAHQGLEAYAQALLEEKQHDQYGFWSVFSYPEEGMVEFHTGGSGLAPGSIYEGFYYSADDVHIPYQGFDMEMYIQGDTAYWSEDPATSDNWGKSTKIIDHWYWFEAHF